MKGHFQTVEENRIFCGRKEERCVCGEVNIFFCCSCKESKGLEVNFALFFLTHNDQILCSSNPPDRHKSNPSHRHKWGLFSCSGFAGRGRMNVKCSCFIYQVDMKFTKAIFDCEGLLELKKIRHPTCTLF